MPDLGYVTVTLSPQEHAALLRYGRRRDGMCAVLMCWRKAAKKRKRCEEHLRIDRERMKAARARDGALPRNHSQ